MNWRRELSGYWQLFLLMYFPARWVFILGAVGVGSAALGASLWLIIHLTSIGSSATGVYKFFLFAGILTAAIPLIFGLLLLPAQSCSLCTSKQFILLANIRKKIFAIVASILIIYPIALSVAYVFKEPSELSPARLFVLAFFCLSAFLFFSIRMFGINPAFNIFIALPFFLAIPAIKLLSYIPSPLIFIGTILIWLSFSRWWFRWKPKKFTTNAFGNDVNLRKVNQSTSQVQWLISLSIQKQSNSWVFSRLLGRSDAYANILVGDSIAVLMTLSIFVCMSLPSISDGKSLIDFPVFNFIFNHFTFIWFYVSAVIATVLSNSFHKNLKMIWITTQVHRNKLFDLLERKFLKLYLLKIIPFAPLLMLLFLFTTSFNNLVFTPIYIPLGIAIGFVYFYLDVFIQDVLPKESVLAILLTAIKFLVPLFLISWISDRVLIEMGVREATPTLLGVLFVLLLLATTLRYFAKKTISQIDFMGRDSLRQDENKYTQKAISSH